MKKEFNCNVPSGHNSFLYLLKGELKIEKRTITKLLILKLNIIKTGE